MSSIEKPHLRLVWDRDRVNRLTGNVLLAPVNRLCVEPADDKQNEPKRGKSNA